VRDDEKQDGDDDEEQWEEKRALDRDDLFCRAAGEVDAARARDGDLEPQPVDGGDDDQLQERKPGDQVAAPAGEQA
jgi:hypothetical protein